ncbi:MAG: helix-turn-helix transcriptional regulator, partial [Gordonia sp. (in: high G+C Gram-positive bacteria)]|uniref:helix-turn-helix domain-containing protein n=1 Tax=Gordonia sp. (in: high G+C Gram-positive bacteria) TaxID=84139 RepID=UPI003BB60A8E
LGGLTARQREILALAGAGMTNQQIAAALGLSVRTVEGHRYRATCLEPREIRVVGYSPPTEPAAVQSK